MFGFFEGHSRAKHDELMEKQDEAGKNLAEAVNVAVSTPSDENLKENLDAAHEGYSAAHDAVQESVGKAQDEAAKLNDQYDKLNDEAVVAEERVANFEQNKLGMQPEVEDVETIELKEENVVKE